MTIADTKDAEIPQKEQVYCHPVYCLFPFFNTYMNIIVSTFGTNEKGKYTLGLYMWNCGCIQQGGGRGVYRGHLIKTRCTASITRLLYTITTTEKEESINHS